MNFTFPATSQYWFDEIFIAAGYEIYFFIIQVSAKEKV